MTDATGRMLSSCDGVRKGIFLMSRLAVSVALLVLSVALLVGATNNAFIYTRF